MPKKLLEIAAEIIQAQASIGQMSPGEIEEALTRTFLALQKMQQAEESGVLLDQAKGGEASGQEEAQPEKINPLDSIREDRVICLECGAEMKQITAKHLGVHAMSPKEYRRKHGIPLKTSLTAKSISKARSKAAKKRGLPEKLKQYQEQRRREREGAPASEPAQDVIQAQVKGAEATGETKKKRGRKKETEE